MAHGIGSDCAILLPPVAAQIVSVDTLVEGVHFDTRYMTWEDAGYRAVTTCLSDLAAGGADSELPVIAFASLAIGSGLDEENLLYLEDGIAQACDEYHVTLAGGDTVVSSGPTTLTFTVIGQTPRPMTRAGAKAGHIVMAAGYFGGAGAALELLKNGRVIEIDALLLEAYRRPKPLLKLGGLLTRFSASACADVSDGLLADAGHIAEQSGLGMRLDLDALAVHPVLASHRNFSDREKMELAASFGDDYALVFTCPPAMEKEMLESAKSLGAPCAKIGRCVKAPSGSIEPFWRGKPFAPARRGYEH